MDLESWIHKDGQPTKIGPEIWKRGEKYFKVWLGMPIIPRKIGIPERALSGHIKITSTIWKKKE